jgi:hypothetical protein
MSSVRFPAPKIEPFADSLLVDWFDPNSVKENDVTSSKCSYTWKWDGVTAKHGANNTFNSEDMLPCEHNGERTPFEMRVNGFRGPTNLTLWISHYYKDTE